MSDMYPNNVKICAQCCRQLPLNQFRTYKTKGGLKYRNYCHQCTYNNNRFNILSKERKEHCLNEVDATVYDMLIQLFDAYADMGGTIGSGAYNELRGRSKKEATLEQQLAEAQQLLSTRNNPAEYVVDGRYVEGLQVDDMDKELVGWLQQPMTEWRDNKYKPSFLRAVCNDIKTHPLLDVDLAGVKKLSTKIWDYEEYLADYFKNDLPDWLKGEELIV